jgi:hypothetical protein
MTGIVLALLAGVVVGASGTALIAYSMRFNGFTVEEVGQKLALEAPEMELGPEARTALEVVGTALADDGYYNKAAVVAEVRDILRPRGGVTRRTIMPD